MRVLRKNLHCAIILIIRLIKIVRALNGLNDRELYLELSDL